MKYLILTAVLLITPTAAAQHAKVTVVYPDKEEKTFRFHKQEKPQSLNLNSRWSSCLIDFGGEPEGVKYVELSCTPTNDGLTLKDRKRLYSTRAACLPKILGSIFIIYDFPPTKSTAAQVSHYSVQLECEP